MPAFQRNGYQSMTVKLADPSMFDSFKAAIEADPRLYLQPQREQDYYTEQSRAMTTVIRAFGTFVTLILSIGAMFGAMNTMYAAVAYRTREIGTLRALGFSRLRIVSAFLVESVARAIGLTLCCHRSLAPRAFKMGRAAQCVWAFIGTAAMQKGPLWWAGHHVSHHKYADRDGDPHSPMVSGVYYAHIGWFLNDTKYD